MLINSIDAKTLQKIFIAGAKYLESKKDYVNELNVFPVPDGDTGTNMSLTILSAAKEVNNVSDLDMKTISKAISSGSLRGARGNSGVILSQLFRGFAKEISEHNKIDTIIMANAFERGVETAYKAVMKPKEGTILTVARALAEKSIQLAVDSDDIYFVLKESIIYAKEILSQTPDMLPVLKQAGVIDAGGQGLIYILEGAFKSLNGEEIDYSMNIDSTSSQGANINYDEMKTQGEDIKFGYCTEFIINLAKDYTNTLENDLKSYLESIGDSIVVVADDDLVKVHVHTNDPGNALQKGLSYGALTSIKIDNMREQHTSRVVNSEVQKMDIENRSVEDESVERKDIGFLTVSIGDGLNEIFKGLGADYIIEGGQTMNPSTEEMVNAINNIHANNIFILPNNKNIILAAQQADELIDDKNIIVIPTKSIPEGITAIINYEYGKGPEENKNKMIEALDFVKTGQLTFAVRDTNIEDKEIKEDDVLGIGEGKILVVGKDITQAAKDLLDQLIDEDSELISIYYGEDVNKDEVKDLESYIEEKYCECDLEVHYGGQPLYYYIMSVE